MAEKNYPGEIKQHQCDVCKLQNKTENACKYCTECEELLCEGCDQNHKVQKATKSHTTCPINEIPSIKPDAHHKYCDICQLNDVIKEALSYCKECEEKLCDDCLKMHKARKASKGHDLMSLADIEKTLDVKNTPCDPCIFRGTKGIAKWFCEECEESLCDSCCEAHKKAKATKHHGIADIAAGPAYMDCDLCSVRNVNERAILFCEECEEKLCKICSDEHKLRKITKTHLLVSLQSLKKGKDTPLSTQRSIAESQENQNQRKINDERPGTPTPHDVSTDSITIKWSKPANSERNIIGYDIRFRDVDSSLWRVISTSKPDDIETISHLKGDTGYEFKVRANYGDEDGPYSNTSAEIHTMVSLAKTVVSKCMKIQENLKQDQPMKYKIPLIESQSSRNNRAKTRKLVFGQADRNVVQEKTIMVVGATGAGKSTLIDGMINFILDVSWEDNFRFTVIDLTQEEKSRSKDQLKDFAVVFLPESEKREAKPGFQSRVNLLEQLKKDAELMQKLPKGDVKVFGDLNLDEITDPNETAPITQSKGFVQKFKFW